jgi:putative Holliday junction resolvase
MEETVMTPQVGARRVPPRAASWLGLDVGERRIGVAVASSDGGTAMPVGVIERVGGDADYLKVLEEASARQAETLVVGMPISMNGSKGPQARAVQAFVREIKQHTQLPVVMWDERLTTVEADRRLREARGNVGRGGRPARARGPGRDAVAAALILQAYLDAQSWRGR